MIRAYVEKALVAYKRPSSKASSSWITAVKAERGSGRVGSVLGKQLLSGIGKLGKNAVKQALLRNAIPNYRLLANRGGLPKDYVQRKQRGQGIWLSPTTQILSQAMRRKQKGGFFPLLAAALPTVLTALGTGL